MPWVVNLSNYPIAIPGLFDLFDKFVWLISAPFLFSELYQSGIFGDKWHQKSGLLRLGSKKEIREKFLRVFLYLNHAKKKEFY